VFQQFLRSLARTLNWRYTVFLIGYLILKTGRNSMTWHEPYEKLSEETRDLHRALRSLIEELEAIDWYQQRIDAASDDELRAVVKHNRDEEMEHAAMTLEWIRRRMPDFDKELRDWLFTEKKLDH
jgi:uncharacterized protein